MVCEVRDTGWWPRRCRMRSPGMASVMEVNRHSYESGSRSRVDLAPLSDKTIESRNFPEQARIFCRASSLILGGLSRRPGQRSSADEVYVEVEDGLPRSRPDVQDSAVALLDI